MGIAEKTLEITERQVGRVMSPGFAAQIQAMQQVAEQLLKNYIDPILKAMDGVRKQIQQIIKWAQQVFNSIAKPLSFLFTFKPVYYVPTQPLWTEQPKCIDRHLVVTQADYGFFVIDGQRLDILNPASSRCGRMLAALVKRRSRIVDYETLQQEIGAGDLDKTFKDLKRQLNRRGYDLEYERPRSQGIALVGLKYLQ